MSDVTTLRNQMAGGQPTRYRTPRAAAARPVRPVRPVRRQVMQPSTTSRPSVRPVAQVKQSSKARHSAVEIFRMPTVAEIVAAGFPAAKWQDVKKEHEEIVRRFNTDPTFRARVLAHVERYGVQRAFAR